MNDAYCLAEKETTCFSSVWALHLKYAFYFCIWSHVRSHVIWERDSHYSPFVNREAPVKMMSTSGKICKFSCDRSETYLSFWNYLTPCLMKACSPSPNSGFIFKHALQRHVCIADFISPMKKCVHILIIL